MSGLDLTSKRVLILGAETEIGRAVTTAVAEAGACVAAVAATSDAEAAFAVQRLVRRLSSGERKVIAQAIDATNEAAVRVMVRQVSKELGGLDAVVFCADLGPDTEKAFDLTVKSGHREMSRRDGGVVVAHDPGVGLPDMKVLARQPIGREQPPQPEVLVSVLRPEEANVERTALLLLDRMDVDLLSVAGEPDSG